MIDPQTAIGEVQLTISDLDRSLRFVDILGFELMQRYGPSALFVSAGGYHHHFGLNTRAGVDAPPPPPGALGLRQVVVSMTASGAAAVVDRLRAAAVPFDATADGALVHDPAGNAIMLRTVA